MTLPKQRDRSIDGLRCIGICAVVLGHFCALVQEWVYSFHLPLFFVIGGLLYRPTNTSFTSYVTGKAKSLLLPFYAYGLGLLIYWLVFERYFRASTQDFPWHQSLYGLLYAANGPNFWLRFGGAIWFLPCYFCAVICYEAISRVAVQRKHIVLFIVMVTSIIAYIYNTTAHHINLPFGLNQALTGLPWMWIGSYFADKKIITYLKEEMSKTWCVLFAVTFLFLSLVSDLKLDLFSCTLGASWIQLYSYSMGGILLCIFLGVLFQGSKIVQLIGASTLTIMCLHQVIGRILFKLISLMTGVETKLLFSKGYSIAVCIVIVAICVLVQEAYLRILAGVKLRSGVASGG